MDFGHVNLGGGRRLLLTGGGQGWLWLMAGLAALALIVALYRYERRLVTRRTGLILLAARLLAGLALIFALFNPIAEIRRRETIRGRVVLGVDLSESMTTADPGRSAEEREKLRRALDLSANEPIEAMPRREVERRLIGGKWARAIAEAHDVEAIGFARDAAPGKVETLAELLRRPSKPDDPAGSATDWEPVLAEALKEKPAPVVGVVLLTDGRRNAPGDPGPMADRLAARGIPVFPVLIGSATPPRDAAIASIKAPESVYKGDTANVEVTLKLDGPPGLEVPVTLDRPGASPLRKSVKVPADGSRPVVAFAVPMDEVGPQALGVAVGPIGGDVRPDNDRRSVTVQVADDKARALLVDGEARWEFQYVRNALARDPRVAVEAVVFHQPRSASAAETSYKNALPPRPNASSKQPDPLGAFDAIVLGDVDPADLPAESWARLERYVAERGGTLVFSPGPRHWPSLPGGEVASKLLPVLGPRPAAIDPGPGESVLPPGAAIAPALSATADAWPMLQFAAEPERSRAIWSALPKLPWVLAGRPKPSASVLASVVGGGAGDEDSAAIAAMPYGLGKVLWVGTDATWRWRYRVGDAYHHRFWGQVVRWAASGKLAAGNRLVRFGPERPKISEGDGAAILARFAEGAPGVGPDLLVAARVFKVRGGRAEGEAVAVVPLRPRADQPRAFEGKAPALPVGAYAIRLDVPQLAEALRAEGPDPEAPLEVSARETSERVELAALRDPLDRLASATGGQVFSDAEAGALPELLKARTIERVRREETPLWDRPIALILFFAVLTVEWALRKRAGLP